MAVNDKAETESKRQHLQTPAAIPFAGYGNLTRGRHSGPWAWPPICIGHTIIYIRGQVRDAIVSQLYTGVCPEHLLVRYTLQRNSLIQLTCIH